MGDDVPKTFIWKIKSKQGSKRYCDLIVDENDFFQYTIKLISIESLLYFFYKLIHVLRMFIT
jgi:hypothetical protein